MRIGTVIMWAALSGLLSVLIGAFGAHGVSNLQAKAWIETAAHQQMAHTLAIFVALYVHEKGGFLARFAIPFFAIGIFLFAGSLYALAFGAPRMVAMAAPLGGLCLMIGWGVLAWAGFKLGIKTI